MTLFPSVSYGTAMRRFTNGTAVRALREAIGIAHGKFAVRCQITPGYLTNIEKGVKQPSPAVAVQIANALGVPLDAITYVADQPNATPTEDAA